MDIITSFTLFMSNIPQNKPLSQCYSLNFGHKLILTQ